MTRSAGNVFVCIHLDRARGVCIHSRATAAANHPSRAQATYSGSKVGGFHIGANFLGEQHSSCLSQYRGYIYIPKVSKFIGARMRMILPICSAAHQCFHMSPGVRFIQRCRIYVYCSTHRSPPRSIRIRFKFPAWRGSAHQTRI